MVEDLAGGQAFPAQCVEPFQNSGSGMGRGGEDRPANDGGEGFALTEFGDPQFFICIQFKGNGFCSHA